MTEKHQDEHAWCPKVENPPREFPTTLVLERPPQNQSFYSIQIASLL